MNSAAAGLCVVGAVCVLASAAAAEPANPHADLAERMGVVRGSILPADKRASGLPGPAAAWNGSAYWQVLSYCSSMHKVQSRRFRVRGEPAQEQEAQRLGEHFQQLALDRLVKDRAISEDEAWETNVEPEGTYWTMSFVETPMVYEDNARLCRFVEIRQRPRPGA